MSTRENIHLIARTPLHSIANFQTSRNIFQILQLYKMFISTAIPETGQLSGFHQPSILLISLIHVVTKCPIQLN